MSMHLCLTVRFLDPCFHGRGESGVEWPPSPMRAFQALIAAAARLGRGEPGASAVAALRWLESLETPPMIVAPESSKGSPYMTSVPNNAMDIAGRAWSRDPETTAKEADPRTHRTMKEIRPMLLRGEAVHYVWPMPDGDSQHVAAISRSAQSISALGWGIDMVIGQASLLSAGDVASLQGERWLPAPDAGGEGLRVPIRNSYSDLKARYDGFINRMSDDGFVAPPAVTAYRKVEYRRATDPAPHPLACFSLLKPDGSGFRSFDTAREALTVAGMMRRAASDAARTSGWPDEKRNAVILGHPGGENRFAYVPLPTIEARGEDGARRIGLVRRLMLTSVSNSMGREFAWARRNLSGRDLYPEGAHEPAAMLSLVPESDPMVQRYVRPGAVWATVTPVVLPGFDDPAHLRRRMEGGCDPAQQKAMLDRLDKRIDGLLRKAIVQAGLPEELAQCAELDWRKTGFWAGADMADRYGVPDHLKRFPRYHVRVRWRDKTGRPVKVPGPLCIGGGRFYGLGLFASVT